MLSMTQSLLALTLTRAASDSSTFTPVSWVAIAATCDMVRVLRDPGFKDPENEYGDEDSDD
ncbi:hypothetical protein I3842_07G228000 [Carya illinoinensis]|uniref:Secreted protein n=1 Tax=Carya illinoinensis TaxID=32201 RepID=A0A922EPY9_CARIL|nr:hypothetical protein I3842_07G228000 [Carya illinoinensis]